MRKQLLKRKRWGSVLLLVMGLFAVTLAVGVAPAATQNQPVGIICTRGLEIGTEATFSLTTTTGYIATPDDNVIYMWGYTEGSNPFQHPSPVLCVDQGDTVTVILNNTLTEDSSIMFPGQEDVQADGAPAQPQFDNGSGDLTSLTNVAPANGGSVTYSFTASEPGTFVYQSGTDPARQVRMGLFGVLIVRPTGHPDWVNNAMDGTELPKPLNAFNPDQEFMVLLSEVDPKLNQAVERGLPFDMSNYHPRYWLINGRGFPDSLAPNGASWLPAQPYGALQEIEPFDETTNPLSSLVRYIAFATEDLAMHPHSKSARIVGRDGRALVGPDGEDLSFEAFSIPMGPGQTWDGIMSWYDPEQYDIDALDKQVTVDIPTAVDVDFGPLFSGSPYLGEQGVFPVDFTTLNQCGEYYHISHVHALHKLTSWGFPMSGPITFMRVNPLGGCAVQALPLNVSADMFCQSPEYRN